MRDIYELVTTEKTAYETRGIPIAGGWEWSMYNHCNYSLLMKNGQFPITQLAMGEKPSKNIVLPIVNVAYRTEGFDVKDIEPYVNDKDNHYKSLLVRKFHPRWARKWGMDNFIDDVVESQDDGLTLVKNVQNQRPEVISMQQIAFCDQTDILSGTLGLKHQYTIDQLKDTVDDLGWYKSEVDTAIKGAREEKTNDQSFGNQQNTPGKYIEVYEVHGTFPQSWLKKEGEEHEDYNAKLDGDKYSKQVHIITYTQSDSGTKKGLTLFKGPEKKSIFKALKRTNFYGRACGRGRIEELFEPQIWTNFNMIHMQNMLAEASKVIQVTTDTTFTTRNKTKNTKGGEVFVIEDGKEIHQLNTQPINYQLFDKASLEWEQHARTTGSASDPALGLDPVSGTPLGTTQIVTQQGEGIHEYRRGKTAQFIGEIYRDWILQYLVDEMNKGDSWLEELDTNELQQVAETVSIKTSNKRIKDQILSGKMVTKEEQDTMRQLLKDEFMKKGRKHFMEIMKGEFEELPIDVEMNVARKQKNLQALTDKLSNVFRSIFANPQGFVATMQIPAAAKAFNEMLEASGLNPMDFSVMPTAMQAPPSQAPPEAQLSPLQPAQLTTN